jgi:hypothetical protein
MPRPEGARWLALHIDILPADVADLTPIILSADKTPALVYLSAMTKRSRRVMLDGLRIAGLSATLTCPPTACHWCALQKSALSLKKRCN